MFKHLLHKPSAQTVSSIIKNAVEIEQVSRSSAAALWRGGALSVCLLSSGVPDRGSARQADRDELPADEDLHRVCGRPPAAGAGLPQGSLMGPPTHTHTLRSPPPPSCDDDMRRGTDLGQSWGRAPPPSGGRVLLRMGGGVETRPSEQERGRGFGPLLRHADL